jgi:PKD repeat protein
MGIRRVVLFAVIVSLFSACSGHPISEPVPGGNTQVAAASRSESGSQPVVLPAGQAWQQLIAHQQAGQAKYAASQIMVVYLDPANVRPLAKPNQAALQAAAALPNPTLRRNKQYEAISGAIAADYGLSIHQQVYRGDCNIASFDVPDGIDAQQVLLNLRQAYSGQVAYALFSPLLEMQYTPNDPDYTSGWLGPLWDRWQIHCSGGWDFSLGSSSVIIAVVDTGVRITHEELSAQVINPATQFSSSNCDVVNGDKTVEDLEGHGTFIAGIIASQADNGRTLVGVAPRCRVLPIKISNDGYSLSADLVAGCFLAADLGAKVINLSFGSYEQIPAEESMVNQLTASGVLLVSAAGNDGLFTVSYPAAYSNALCVGSTDFDDNCTSFSNWGMEVDIAAPGIDMKSCSNLSDQNYEYGGEGTSFSAPLVAAAAGLLWSYDPTLTRAEVRDALENHGYPAWNFATIVTRLDLPMAFSAVVVPVTPTVAGLNVADGSVWGAVAAKPTLAVQLAGAQNVASASYTLDIAPLEEDQGEDLQQDSSTGPGFAAQFDVSAIPNQTAVLHVTYKSITNTEGTPLTTSQHIFNQRGDANCDGVVDYADHTGYAVLAGLHQGAAGYLPFYDSDLDGVITESDASAVGYFYNGVWPGAQVVSVTPLTGSTGQQITFDADVMGNEPITYAWNFGGGTSPNTSTAVAPTVVLGAIGSYAAQLVVSNAFGHSTYPFTLEVGELQPPSASFTATPSKGSPPLAVDFDASASMAVIGAITKYQWSWDGDTTWEEERDSPLAAHTFNNYGTYDVLLRVTDEEGLTDDATQTIKVADAPNYQNWEKLVLGPWGSWVTGDDLRLANTLVNGRTAIAWNEHHSPSDSTLHLAWAKNSGPTSVSDWYSYSKPITALGNPLSVADCGGRFTVAYKTWTALYYTEWDGTNATETLFATLTNNSCTFVALAEIAGKPAMVFTAELAGDPDMLVHYAYATINHPSSSADWVISSIADTGYSFAAPYSNNVQLCEVDGKPMIVSLSGGMQDNLPFIVYLC